MDFKARYLVAKIEQFRGENSSLRQDLQDSSVDDLIEIILSKTEKVSELEKQVFKLKKKLNADKDYDKICLKIEKKEEKLQEITENLQTLRKEVRKLRKEKKELLEDLKAQF